MGDCNAAGRWAPILSSLSWFHSSLTSHTRSWDMCDRNHICYLVGRPAWCAHFKCYNYRLRRHSPPISKWSTSPTISKSASQISSKRNSLSGMLQYIHLTSLYAIDKMRFVTGYHSWLVTVSKTFKKTICLLSRFLRRYHGGPNALQTLLFSKWNERDVSSCYYPLGLYFD